MNLWENDIYINNSIPYLFNTDIYEYDMKDGGLSLIQEYELLPDDEIKRLLSYGNARTKGGRKKHTVEEGKLQIKNEKLKEGLKKGFKKARKMFFEENNLSDSDIISIKKDAIFVSKKCIQQLFGKFINFREKHHYTSYIRLKGLEIYYSPYDFDIKGISKELLAYHEEYMISFIKRFCNKMETSTKEDVLQFLTRFSYRYKNRELDIGYYRRLDKKSNYDIKGENDMIYMEVDLEDLENLDISYNFLNIIKNLVKIPL